MPVLDVRDMSKRVWLAGGRDQVPAGFLRRAKGIAPEFTGSVKSMWPPQLQYANITALNLEYFQGNYYQFDGTKLYRAGASIYSGGGGARGTFAQAPPNTGLQDYLFLAGSGPLVKVDSSNNVTNWGIQPPNNSLVATNLAPDEIVIDSFDGTASNWTPTSATIANSSAITPPVANRTDVVKVNAVSAGWKIINTTSFAAGPPAQDLGNYVGGDISLPTDIISIWFYFSDSDNIAPQWLQFDFDVRDGSFKRDYYSIAVALVPSGAVNPQVERQVAFTVGYQNNQWQQLFLPKQQFTRIGSALQFDWTIVEAIRISGSNFANLLYLSNYIMYGGSPLGAGPAAASGGSLYNYYTVFRSLVTGNQSNPQDSATLRQAVAVNKVALTHVPISSDSQVGARDLYRTTAGAAGATGTPAYLDTIYDNTTTTYTDNTADSFIPETLTPWQPSVGVPPNTAAAAYYVDGGNGYYFKLVTAGGTGSVPPQWNFPNATWAAQAAYFLGDTTSMPNAQGYLWAVGVAGVSGIVQPNWGALLTAGDQITDGTVIWVNQGLQTTIDGTAVWQFEGVNSTRVLGNSPDSAPDNIVYDNMAPLSTIQDAVYWKAQNVMVFARDSANPGRVYFSPPGRLESIQTFTDIGSSNDVVQKVVDYQNTLWAVTQKQVGYFNIVTDSAGNVSYQWVKQYTDGVGTDWPFTVIETQAGIFYRGTEGIRRANWGVDGLFGFDPIAPVLRGYTVGDIPPFYPLIAGLGRNEIYFSDTTAIMMAVDMEKGVWRTFDQPVTAINYIRQTGQIVASYGGNVYLWEDQTLSGSPVPFDWEVEVPSVEIANSAQNQSQRVYLDINTGGQQVTPTLLVDTGNYVLPVVLTTNRQTIELPQQVYGQVFGVLLQAQPSTGVIEVFRVAVDITS